MAKDNTEEVAEEMEEETTQEVDTEENVSEDTSESGERMDGTVKWFDPVKAYGFITGSDGKDYFIHESDLPFGVTITQDDSVSFVPASTDKGMKATEVEKVEE